MLLPTFHIRDDAALAPFKVESVVDQTLFFRAGSVDHVFYVEEIVLKRGYSHISEAQLLDDFEGHQIASAWRIKRLRLKAISFG